VAHRISLGPTLAQQERAHERLIKRKKRLNDGDATHDWFIPKFIGYECCRRCGIVRRSDRQNTRCKGTVKVGPR